MLERGTEGPLRLGVIGAGFIAQVAHLPAFSEVPDCRIAAIADNRDGLRERVAGRYGIGSSLPSHRRLLEDPDIDAVVVSMPRRCQAPIVEEALASGKAVLAEKPMGHTLAQGRRLVACAERHRAPYAIGFMKRHDPAVRLFRDRLAGLCAGRELGAPVHVAVRDFCAAYAVPIPPHERDDAPRPFRYDEWAAAPDGLAPELHGEYEYTLNVVSHDINLLRFLFGDGLGVTAFRIRPGRSQTAVLSAGDFDIVLQAGRAGTGAWDQSVDVFFEKGLLRLSLPSPLSRQEVGTVSLTAPGRQEVTTLPPHQRVWAFRAQAERFVSALRGREPLEASGRDCLGDLRLIEALWSKLS